MHVCYAAEPPPGGGTPGEGKGAGWGSFAPMMMFVFFLVALLYIFMIGPQKRKEQERRRMIDAVAKKDRILTHGGIWGEVVEAGEKDFLVRIDPRKDVQIRIVKDAVLRTEKKGESAEEAERKA